MWCTTNCSKKTTDFRTKYLCMAVFVLTAAQHGDAWSHIQVQRCSEWVAGRRTHTAAEQQDLQRRGSSSLHPHRASRRTHTLRPGCIYMQWHSHNHIPPKTHINSYTHMHSDKHWQTSRQPLSLCRREDWRNLKKENTHIQRNNSVSSQVNTKRKKQTCEHCDWKCDTLKSQRSWKRRQAGEVEFKHKK